MTKEIEKRIEMLEQKVIKMSMVLYGDKESNSSGLIGDIKDQFKDVKVILKDNFNDQHEDWKKLTESVFNISSKVADIEENKKSIENIKGEITRIDKNQVRFIAYVVSGFAVIGFLMKAFDWYMKNAK